VQKLKPITFVFLCGLTALGLTIEARAALLFDEDQLSGATGVNVNGMLYDVRFPDRTCFEAFDGCDEVSDFDFQNEADATAAAQALMDQVFVDTIQGMFDSDPRATLGCRHPYDCWAAIPFGFNLIGRENVSFAAAENYDKDKEMYDGVICCWDQDIYHNRIGLATTLIYARFTPQVTVPEPGTIWLCGVGLAALALVGWRHSHRPRIA